MKLVIAEKPSVAQSIAAVVGATESPAPLPPDGTLTLDDGLFERGSWTTWNIGRDGKPAVRDGQRGVL